MSTGRAAATTVEQEGVLMMWRGAVITRYQSWIKVARRGTEAGVNRAP